MSEWSGAVSILSTLSEACDGSFRRLLSRLPSELVTTGPATELFRIEPGSADAGVAVRLEARRSDGRDVSWLVEAWIYPDGADAWRVNVKAEIDLDDHNGDDHCIVNDEEIVNDPAAAAAAIRRAAEIVVSYPRDDLLAEGWQPAEWADNES